MGSYHIILLFRELLNFSSDNDDLGAEFVYSRGKEGGGGVGGNQRICSPLRFCSVLMIPPYSPPFELLADTPVGDD